MIRPSNSTLPPSVQALSYKKVGNSSADSSDDFANLRTGGAKEKRAQLSDDQGATDDGVGSSIPYEEGLGDFGRGVGAEALAEATAGGEMGDGAGDDEGS